MHQMLNCLSCFIRDRVPGQLVVQITSRCNAHCPQCGMRVTAAIPRSTLETDAIKRILDAAAARGVQAVSFTGGEPLLYMDRLVELINHAGKAGIPFIRTGTNGFLFCNSHREGFISRVGKLAERLAATPVRNFWISLDSYLPHVHDQMRGLDGVSAGIEKALPVFHEAGLFPSVNLGINRRIGGDLTGSLNGHGPLDEKAGDLLFYHTFKQAFDYFYCRVVNLGFTIANTCYPMSIGDAEHEKGLDAIYPATAADDVVRFAPWEKKILYRALTDSIAGYRHQLRIFTPLSTLHVLGLMNSSTKEPKVPTGCRGGRDFFFISAEDGDTYPCGYRGHDNLGLFQNLDMKSVQSDENCTRCDWECFRDPSEMFGPFRDVFHRPLGLIKRFQNDPEYFGLWIKDMQYYLACDLFNGRVPMNLRKFSKLKPGMPVVLKTRPAL